MSPMALMLKGVVKKMDKESWDKRGILVRKVPENRRVLRLTGAIREFELTGKYVDFEGG